MNDAPDPDPASYSAGQRWGDHEFHPSAPTLWQRVIFGLFVVAYAVVIANRYLDWGLLGRYDKAALGAMTLVGFVLMLRLMPTVRRRE